MASLTPTSPTNGSFEEVFTTDTTRSASPATQFADHLAANALSNPEIMNFDNLREIFRTFGSQITQTKDTELAAFQERQVTIIQDAYQRGIREGKQLGHEEGEAAGYEQGLEEGKQAQALEQSIQATKVQRQLAAKTESPVAPHLSKSLQDVATQLSPVAPPVVESSDFSQQAMFTKDANDASCGTEDLFPSHTIPSKEFNEIGCGSEPVSPSDERPAADQSGTASASLDSSGVSLADEILLAVSKEAKEAQASVLTKSQEVQTDPLSQSHIREIATVATSALVVLAVGYVSHTY